jgi:hypothetical protein
MSRICNFEDTTTGHPCENVVEDGHDHCAAGHLCPPVQPVPAELQAIGHAVALALETEDLADTHAPSTDSGPTTPEPSSPKPVLSAHVLDLKHAAQAAQEKAQAAYEAFGSNSLAYKKAHQDAYELTNYAYGRQTAELLADCLDLPPVFPKSSKDGDVIAYQTTIHEKGIHVSVLDVGSIDKTPPTQLARGYIKGRRSRHWYLVTTCTDHLDEDPCNDVAYVKLKHGAAWYGPYRSADVTERRATFTADIAAAQGVVALCEHHRHPAHHVAQADITPGLDQVDET